MNLGKSIQSLRKRQGLTQEALAERAGLSRPAISQIENNSVRPEQETLKRICKALDVPESLVYIHSFEKEDVAVSKQGMYDQLFPIIQNMIEQLAIEGNKSKVGRNERQ
jgi:transcriptional regulator with XRE-family HTH domain